MDRTEQSEEERPAVLVAHLENALAHDYCAERFRKAYAFLQRDDLAALPVGRIDIDGDEVFANVQEYETEPADQRLYEAHRRYYDVQFMVAGAEAMLYAPLETLSPEGEFDEEGDGGAYSATHTTPESEIVLLPGDMAVVAPEDAHKPRCIPSADGDRPQRVRKIVVKVLA